MDSPTRAKLFQHGLTTDDIAINLVHESQQAQRFTRTKTTERLLVKSIVAGVVGRAVT
jgi:hypothetical protein